MNDDPDKKKDDEDSSPAAAGDKKVRETADADGELRRRTRRQMAERGEYLTSDLRPAPKGKGYETR